VVSVQESNTGRGFTQRRLTQRHRDTEKQRHGEHETWRALHGVRRRSGADRGVRAVAGGELRPAAATARAGCGVRAGAAAGAAGTAALAGDGDGAESRFLCGRAQVRGVQPAGGRGAGRVPGCRSSRGVRPGGGDQQLVRAPPGTRGAGRGAAADPRRAAARGRGVHRPPQLRVDPPELPPAGAVHVHRAGRDRDARPPPRDRLPRGGFHHHRRLRVRGWTGGGPARPRLRDGDPPGAPVPPGGGRLHRPAHLQRLRIARGRSRERPAHADRRAQAV
ncbi:MAG: hypothetical protein AVDCRST_MAG68-2192, partial [uncultured Gemmatimonadetes bacterium]